VYRLFIDEVGHDNLNTANDPREQFLCLMGAILEIDYAHAALASMMDSIKVEAFGTKGVVLHRREIIDRKPQPFNCLSDDGLRARFNESLISLIGSSDFSAIAVLIDKKDHIDRYKVWRSHPYHYCLKAMMERYVMFLGERNALGDVMAEWRGIKPNMKLENAYKYIYNNGTENMSAGDFQMRLSSGQLKIKKKEANVAGLQLADLLANPASRDLICKRQGVAMTATFGSRVVKILYEGKYRRSWNGIVKGYGTKTLP